ncbi:MAG: TGS domain-containing protein, partial [Duncaniella sp.]|nr:TGS domain-containing protein [Duncaniella sp.]
IGNHCIAGKVNHKLVPLSHQLASGDQVEVLTSQTQTPKPEWANILSTAKAKTRLRKELRRVQQPFIEEGRRVFEKFLADNSITLNNDVITKILGRYHVSSRDELFMKLGTGEASIDDYLNVNTSSSARSLVSRLLRLGFGGKNKKGKKALTKGGPQPAEPTAEAGHQPIDTKKVCVLHDRDAEPNFVMAPCCHPIPGDDVLGYLNFDGRVEVHSLDCPEASRLKAAHGDRILAVSWEGVERQFLASVRIEGIDRRGILQELTGMIASIMDVDLRRLNIDTHGEVFTCELDVRVTDRKQVDYMCAQVKKIKGVNKAVRV